MSATRSNKRTGAQREVAVKGAPAHGRARWRLLVFVALCLVGDIGCGRGHADQPRANTNGGATRPVHVGADSASVMDFPVHLAALGAVTPLATITVRSRVDGQLIAVRFREGQMLQAGELLAQIDPRPFEAQKQQADAQLARDSAVLDNARIDLKRYRDLLAEDSAPEQQVDTQANLVRQFEAQVELDRGAVENAAVQLGYTRIVSPIAGRAGLRLVDAGNIVHATDTGGLTVITQLKPISVLFSIPQDALPEALRRFQARESLAVDVFDRDGRSALANGLVTTMDNQIDPTTGTVKLRAQLPNKDLALFPNQFVNVRLLVRRIRGATVVPVAAVQRENGGTFVYVVDRANKVRARQVTLGPTEGKLAVITDGLSPRERVIVDGVDEVHEGGVVEMIRPGPSLP